MTAIDMLAQMVSDTQMPLEELMEMFERLPKEEQTKMQEAFKKAKSK